MIAVMDFRLGLCRPISRRVSTGIDSKPWGCIDMGSRVSCSHVGGHLPPTGYAFFP